MTCKCKRIATILAIFAFVAVSRPALSDDVLAGIDLFETPPGSTSDAFNSGAGGTPLPADFFFPGSDPFDGQINLQGNPLGGPFGMADTIVRRVTDATPLPCGGPPVTIPIEIVALDLVSSSPITITDNGGMNPTQWDVRVCLSDQPQQQGTMTINHTHTNGGTFDSTLPVQPKFIFTPVVPGPPQVVFDTGVTAVPPDVLNANGVGWVHVPYNGFGITVVAPGQQADGNCDGNLDPALPGTSNFVAGVSQLQSDCTTPPIDPNNPQGGPVQKKVLTPEQAMLAAHGVLPAEEGLIDCCVPSGACTPGITSTACLGLSGAILPLGTCTAPEACCLPDDTCIMADPACCICQNGIPQGPGTTCAQEACCLPDGTCIMADLCVCAAQGGMLQGPTSMCTAPEACCLPDDTCVMLDPLCCAKQGGAPQGPGTTCKGLVACCFTDGTCQNLDPLCCAANGGRAGIWGSACQGDNNGNGIDDACEEIIPAVSNLGMALLAVLVLIAGVIVIRRTRRGTTGG